jgi:putative ABC transport system substrate-binding protein
MMKKLAKLTSLLLAAAMVFTLASCSSKAPATEEKHYEVGIIKMMDHPALNASEEGFVAALSDNGLVDGQNLTVDYKNSNADSNNYTTIADQFVMDKKDLILAIATPAAQAMAPRPPRSPSLPPP